MRAELAQAERARETLTRVLREFHVTRPESRYDLEYSTAEELTRLTGVRVSFSGTHYWFWSPVLRHDFLLDVVQGPRILDVGAGNGTLLKHLVLLGFPPHHLTGVDISQKAARRIRETGCRAMHGTLARISGQFDSIFLSYFVDRDADQRGTFEKGSELLAPGGTLVLEGLFPCVLSDSSGVSYGTPNVTRGISAEEDIELVVAEFGRLGMKVSRIAADERFVYSLDGPEVLPSYTLVFRKI